MVLSAVPLCARRSSAATAPAAMPPPAAGDAAGLPPPQNEWFGVLGGAGGAWGEGGGDWLSHAVSAGPAAAKAACSSVRRMGAGDSVSGVLGGVAGMRSGFAMTHDGTRETGGVVIGDPPLPPPYVGSDVNDGGECANAASDNARPRGSTHM